jgi:lysozyme family protein
MKANFKPSLAAVLVHEGGFSNHPKDPGGATMKGVTQRVYDAWRRTNGKDQQSVARISDAEIETIYYQQYWLAVRADNLPSGLDYAVFDYAVNSGPSRAIKHLQEVLGVTADGIMGNVTIARASEPETKEKIRALCDRRMKFLRGLPTWDTFGKGWSRRVDGVLSKATAMVSAETVPTPAPPMPLPPQPKPSAGASIGQVMAWIVGALIAGLFAWLGLGGK